MEQNKFINELPLGFSMAMAKNPQALTRFSAMSDEQQHSIIEQCHNVTSKKEMQSLVNSIVTGRFS